MKKLIELIYKEVGDENLSKSEALALIRGLKENRTLGQVLHPLVHLNVSTLQEQRFKSLFTGNEFFLKDHVVLGKKVLPGVACLEMARMAVEQASELNEGDTSSVPMVRLKNVIWVRPIVVEGDTKEVFIRLFVQESNEIQYEIYTKPDAGKESLIHVQGAATIHSSHKTPKLNIENLRAETSLNRLSPEQCYKAFHTVGIDYGSGHRGIQDIRIGENRVLAKLSLPSSVAVPLDRFVLHPSLMDSALQASMALIMETDDLSSMKPSLPFALQQLDIFGQCTESMWAWIRPSENGSPTKKVLKFDLDICDDQGDVRVRMKGLSSRAMEGEESLSTSEALIFHPIWKEGNRSEKTVSRDLLFQGPLRHLVMFYGLEPPEGVNFLQLQSREQSLEKRFPDILIQIFKTIRELIEEKTGEETLLQIFIPSRGEERLLHGLSGLLKTAHLENPKFSGQLIEVDPEERDEGLLRKIEENGQYPEDVQIRYLKGERQVLSWDEASAKGEIDTYPWKDNGVYLITGGTGGLGMIFAKEIASKTVGSQLILTGRSPLSQEKGDQLEELKSLGVGIEYRQVDVTQRDEVDALIQKIREAFGGVNGIIHSAGIIRDNFIIQKSEDEFLNVLGPKVSGVINLDEVTGDLELDFFILFSSLSGVTGNPGQADYCTANAFMDAYAEYRNTLTASGDRHGRTLSINWPLWKAGGMGVDKEIEEMMTRTTGMVPMETRTGVWALNQGLATGMHRMMVMVGDPDQLRRILARQEVSATQSVRKQDERGPETDLEMLREKFIGYFKTLFSTALKLPTGRINEDAPMETYGTDSVMVMQLTNELEKTFGSLPKTLFFEYLSIRDLSGYFTDAHKDKLTRLFDIQDTSTTQNSPQDAMSLRDTVIAGSDVSRRYSRFAHNITLSGEPKDWEPKEIAIIGLAGRYPQAGNIDEFWKRLRDGRDCITEIPKDRWDNDLYFDEDRDKPGKTYSKWGGFLEGVDKFDPLFFNISPREADIVDPQERLFLETAWHTLEDAGYTRKKLQEITAGVFVGVMWSEYQLFGPEETARGNTLVSASSYASIANRVSYFLDLHGPSIGLDTMCSSSLTAIHIACQSIRDKEIDIAIAGGVNLSIHPQKYLQLCQARFASSDGRCRSFGKGGDGYVPGEGVGAVLLKEKNRAIADGDHIYAVIKVSSLNHGGKTNGYTVPNPRAHTHLISDTLKKANMDPSTISYVEAHGTGTSLGDPVEISGLTKAYQGVAQQSCPIGSVKSNIGHLESAAGIAALTKIILQMKHKQICPSLHSEDLNPNINFKETPFFVQQELSPWKRPKIENNGVAYTFPRRAGLSSFGAGGANAHFIIEEYEPEISPREPHDLYIVVLSARNKERLDEYVRNILDFLVEQGVESVDQKDGILPLADIAYTLQIGREPMEERFSLVVADLVELREKFSWYLEGRQEIEGLFRGSSKSDNSITGLLFKGNSGESFIRTVVEKGELHKIAQLWVSGMEIDWDALYPVAKPSRISLPAYPFEKNSHWLPLKPRDRFDQFQEIPSHLDPVDYDLSLKHKGIVFLKTLRDTDPIIKDHQVDGRPILPGTAYLEIALGTAARVRPNTPFNISKVFWVHPLAIENKTIVAQILVRENGEGLAFEIHTDATLHGKGELIPRTLSIEERVSLDDIRERCPIHTDKEILYQQNRKLGLEYGPYFQGISEIQSNNKESLSLICLHDTYENELQDYTLHPAIMDAALQTMSVIPVSEGTLMLPFAIEDVEILKPLKKRMYAHAELSGTHTFHITLMDEPGTVCVRIRNLTVKAIVSNHFLYRIRWKEVPYTAQAKDKDIASRSKRNLVIYSLDGADIEKALTRYHDRDQIRILLGDNTRQISENHYEIRAKDSMALDGCLGGMLNEYPSQEFIEIYFLGGILSQEFELWDIDALEKAQERGVLSLFRLMKSLSRLGLAKEKLEIKVITNRVHSLESESIRPISASLHGLTETIALEFPHLNIRWIDLDLESDEKESDKERLLEQAGFVAAESIANSPSGIVIRRGKGYIKSCEPVGFDPMDQVPFRKKGVYFIVGGAGGIGLELGVYLGKTVNARVVLTGRSPMSEELEKKIRRIEEGGGESLYLQADAGSLDEMKAAVEKAKSRFGNICGVIHSAVVLRDRIIENMDEEDFRAVLVPKIRGSVILSQAMEGEKLDFMMFFSSAVTLGGNPGQSNYVAGCSFKDAFALHLNQKASYPVKVINWGYWGSVGVGTGEEYKKRMRVQGILSIEPEQGMEAIRQILNQDEAQIIPFKSTRNLAEIIARDKRASSLDAPSIPRKISEAGLDVTVKEYVMTVISEVLRIPKDKIELRENLGNYGVDSLSGLEISREFAKIFRDIPQTLFMEYDTVEKVAAFFLTEQRGLVIEHFGYDEASETDLQPLPEGEAPEQAITKPVSYPLSEGQYGLWMVYRMAPESAAYNVAFTFQMLSKPDISALERSLQTLVNRHPVLCTTFTLQGDVPVQVVHEGQKVCLTYIDAQDFGEDELKREVKKAYMNPFNLEQGPVMRVDIFNRSEEDHVFLLTVHHSIIDAWSLWMLIGELRELYTSEVMKSLPSLPPLTHSYQDFVHWQQEILSGPKRKEMRQYWLHMLSGEIPTLNLPFDHPRPSVRTYNGAAHNFFLSEELTSGLKEVALAENSTLFMLFMAAWQVLLYRYTGQSDIWTGIPTAGRGQKEFSNVIGFFVNMVILRGDLSGNPFFKSFLGQIRHSVKEAIEHQDYPFTLLVKELQPHRDPNLPPLFQNDFAFQKLQKSVNPDLTGEMDWAGLKIAPFPIDQQVGQVDLTLEMMELEKSFLVSLKYNSDLFERETIERMANNYQTLLEGLLNNPDIRITQIPLLSKDEQEKLEQWRNTCHPGHPIDRCIHHYIEEQAKQSSTAMAGIFEGERDLTFRELDEQANQLVNYMISQGVEKGSRIGVCQERSSDMLVALLAIFKTGSVYVPLDPEFPENRLSFMVQDALIETIIIHGETETRIQSLQQDPLRLINTDRDRKSIGEMSKETSGESNIGTGAPCYIIYTSGSTGKPKGILIAHDSLASHCLEMRDYYKLMPNDRILQFSSLNVDTSLEQILPGLTLGATIVFRGRELWSPLEFSRKIQDNGITIADIPPAYLRELLWEWSRDPKLAPRELRLVIVGGEALSPEIVTLWRNSPMKSVPLINAYGPTETTITCTAFRITEETLDFDLSRNIPIGRPLSNTSVHILDKDMNPVPIGVTGELHIGGPRVGLGYLNQPELTADRFIPDPFADDRTTEARLYKTGDLARFIPGTDGHIEFAGRIDDQVKIRGFRIELGEIEALLSKHKDVKDVLVISRENSKGEMKLIAYVIPENEGVAEDFPGNMLKNKLPAYMLPSAYVMLDAFPLMPTGKVDRRSLPKPDGPDMGTKAGSTSPRDDLEMKLARLWYQALDIDESGVFDNFFELGGHSISAIRLMALIHKEFGIDLPISKLIQGPTIAEMAEILRGQIGTEGWMPLVCLQPEGDGRPFFCVHAVGGNVLAYRELALELGTNRPFYGLQSPGLDGSRHPGSIEEMATLYIEAIREIQPQGPYNIGGWSMGGVVAYEMAQQLQRSGEKAALVALIESYTPFAVKSLEEHYMKENHGEEYGQDALLLENFARDLGFFDDTTAITTISPHKNKKEMLEQIQEKISIFDSSLPHDLKSRGMNRLFEIFKANTRAMNEYCPQPYKGRVILFRADEEDTAFKYTAAGWSELLDGNLEIFKIPGGHYTIFQKPGLEAIVNKLRVCLS
jgi:amino acid adenylation domain-containing protein